MVTLVICRPLLGLTHFTFKAVHPNPQINWHDDWLSSTCWETFCTIKAPVSKCALTYFLLDWGYSILLPVTKHNMFLRQPSCLIILHPSNNWCVMSISASGGCHGSGPLVLLSAEARKMLLIRAPSMLSLPCQRVSVTASQLSGLRCSVSERDL